MTALLERSYLSRIEQYSGERIVFAGEASEADLATVRTRLVSKGGVETPVDYRLYKVGDRWMVYDVTVEGVSLVANYRAQFNKIIQTSSAQGLVERLRAKQE
jgi:phospholipid transport system substrate-binding protein